jgi:RNA pseudouridylate synthase
MIRNIMVLQRSVLECQTRSRGCRYHRSKSLKNLVSSVLPLFLSSTSNGFRSNVVVRCRNSQPRRSNRLLNSVNLQGVSHVQRFLTGCALKDDFDDEKVTSMYPLSATLENDIKNSSPLPMIHSRTEFSFATHVLITEEEAPISVAEVVRRVLSSIPPEDKSDLSAIDLLQLGSVWYLCAAHVEKYGTFNPSSGIKPTRLLSHRLNDGSDMMLDSGDYLRIHHNPRRFRMVDDYDWSRNVDSEPHTSLESDEIGTVPSMISVSEIETPKPGVIVAADPIKGWIVINKPACIPVHMTVDNALENVASCLQRAMMPSATLDAQQSASLTDVYVATPQRLDQNTSGLLVVATRKPFASYFAQLLRYKTAELLIQHEDLESNASSSPFDATDTSPLSRNGTGPMVIGGVHKLYRCLVCIIPPVQAANSDCATQQLLLPHWSIQKAASEIHDYVRSQRVMRHFLEPSIRAPKRFVLERPILDTATTDTTSLESNEWPEALLRIRKASKVYNLNGTAAALELVRSLWRSDGNNNLIGDDAVRTITNNTCSVPDNCHGVMELEIELLTGRTHQIRGQLAACNFPLVGDVQYGGAAQPSHFLKPSLITERLALQCCALEFVDPDIATGKRQRDGTYPMMRSERWNRFRIETAWWTPLLNQYEQDLENSPQEQGRSSFGTDKPQQPRDQVQTPYTAVRLPRPELLPPRLSLSRGNNKYVLIRAVHPAIPTQEEWFVKSASTKECGGPYHGKSLLIRDLNSLQVRQSFVF